MSPVGHLITASSLATAFLRFHAVPWSDGIVSIPEAVLSGRILDSHAPSAITLIGLGMVLGARAPDRLEVPRFDRRTKIRHSLIPHRTLTHWPLFWMALTAFCGWYWVTGQNFLANSMACAGLGFCAAAWLHLVFDIMTPTGIPLFTPFGRRTSLNLYRTTSAGEWLCILVFVAATQSLPYLLCG
jgi:membrane-bound metal-dependent hydrolase YbcI (DUF457 family)